MASVEAELPGLCGFNSPDVCSITFARFPFLNKRCAFGSERPFRPTLLSPSAAPMRRRLLAEFIRISLICDPEKRHREAPHRGHALTVSDSVEPHHRVDNAISSAASNSQGKLTPAINESRDSRKGFGMLDVDGILSTRKAAQLNNAKERRAAVKSSELEGSNHRGPAWRGVCSYAFYDLDENVSEFSCVNGGGAETVFTISKNWQPPTTFFNGQHIEHAYT